jgi:membrane fusion protein (multidrug efflux system)
MPASRPPSAATFGAARLGTAAWRNTVVAALCASGCALFGCKGQADNARAAPPPVEVGVVTLQPEPVLLTTELPGRLAAYETSEVRPQVSGVIRARVFTEGQLVHQGQTLYRIDDRLYRAAVTQAQANLASAEALNEAAQIKAERYAPLAKERVVSQLDYAETRANAAQAKAAVEQAHAALDTANINLRFTEVPAPITGRIGRSLTTTGALVTSGQAAPLATIQRLDPIFVDLQQSSADLLALRRALEQDGGAPASAEVRLRLEDGSEYPRSGQLEFAEPVVDPSTGSVTLRARFDNPDGLLLPGMYVRASVGQSRLERAILAPQAGVTRDPKGAATVLLVGHDDKVVQRNVEAERAIGDRWLVRRGLAAGDRLIVEGTDKVRPGQTVKAVAVETKPANAAG